MRSARLLPILTALAVLTAGCDSGTPVESIAIRTASTAQVVDGVREVTGETGPGSRYALFVPESWNGSLVLYAHGFRDTAESLSVRDQDNLFAIRRRLTDQGYAVGYSSYSENGFAVKDGMQRTQQLRGLFAAQFGQPRQTLLMGHSLGGLIALGLAERFLQHYSGALVMCGIAGGSRTTVDYIANVRGPLRLLLPRGAAE